MGASRQQSISAAGTVDTALSEAQTEPPRDAKSNSSGAEGDRGSNGRRSPRAARSQISTAIGAVAADSCEKPAGSAAQPSASADGDSALSAAKPEAADGSYDGSIQGHSHGQPVPKIEYPSASGGEQGSIAGHAQAQITPENPLPPPPNPDLAQTQVKVEEPAQLDSIERARSNMGSAMKASTSNGGGSKQSHENGAAAPSGNSKGSPKRPVQRPAQAQVEGVSIHSGGGGRPTPAISVLSHRHLSNDDMQAVWSHDEAHGGGAASNAVPAQASSHHTPQRVLACSSHDRDIRSLLHEAGPPPVNAANSAPVGNIPGYVVTGNGADDLPQRAGSAVQQPRQRDGRATQSAVTLPGDGQQDQGEVGQAGSGICGQLRFHQTNQTSQGGRGIHRGGRHGSQPRTHAYSSSAIVDPAAQPQMARIEGFLDHNPAPRPQVSSIYLQPPPGAPEVTHPKSLLIHDPIEQPQMASIEGWPGPLVVQDRVLPAADIDARQEEGGQEEEEAAEPANPATSVHATVVMDGTLSEGETDHSSMRQGIEGDMGSLEIGEQAGRETAAPFAAANPQDMEPPVGITPIPFEAREPAPTTDSRCASGGPTDDPMEAVAVEDVQMHQDGQAPVEEPNTSAAANAEQDAQDATAAPMEMGSSHHGLQLPVHPATSVHATVMADGTQSDGDTDLSSLQQGGQPAVRNHSTLRLNTVSDGDQEPISVPVKSSDSGQAHALGSMSAPQQRKPATGSTSRALQGESFRENTTPHASNGPGEDASNGHPSDGWKMDGVEHQVGEEHAKRHESATGMGAMLAANPLFPVASSREHSSQPVINQDNHAIDAPADDGNRPALPAAGALSSRCNIMPVHPATSVHATVMMDGEQSEGDTDLSSMRQEVISKGSGDDMDLGIDGPQDFSHKMSPSPTHSDAAPALATYIGDGAMQVSSRSISAGSNGRAGAQIVGGAVGGGLGSRAAGPSNAEIHDSDRQGLPTTPDMPQATKSTAHGRMQDDNLVLSDAEGPQLSAPRNAGARPEAGSGHSPVISGTANAAPVTRAAVSGTSSPMDASFGHPVPNFRAASATLAGSPEAPNPRIRQANTGVHHGAMAISLHHEVPPTPGGEEAEGGSGTWQQVVRRAQAAMMEDDEPSSPLQALAEAGSIGSLGSGGAAEARGYGSRAGSRAGSQSRRLAAPAPDAAAAAAEEEFKGQQATSGTGLGIHQDHAHIDHAHLSGCGVDRVVEHGSGSATMRNAQLVDRQPTPPAPAVSDNHGMCEEPEDEKDIATNNSAFRGRTKRSSPEGRREAKAEDGATGSPTDRSRDSRNPRPANSGTEPSDALVNGSTIGSLGSHGAAGAAATGPGTAACEEDDMLGPSAAQMAAAATAAAAAMSATAGTVLADGAPPVPRSVLGRTGSIPISVGHHPGMTRMLGSPLPVTAFAPERPVSSNQRASSSHRRGGAPYGGNINGYSTIEDGHMGDGGGDTVHSSREGVHRNGYHATPASGRATQPSNGNGAGPSSSGRAPVSNGNASGSRAGRNGYHGHPNHVSTTTQMPIHQPALTVMAPIGAVAGFDSLRTYSNRSRNTSSGRVTSPQPDMRRRKDGSHHAESQAAINGSGPAHSQSSAEIRRSDGKRKRCSSVEYPEKQTESSITSSIS